MIREIIGLLITVNDKLLRGWIIVADLWVANNYDQDNFWKIDHFEIYTNVNQLEESDISEHLEEMKNIWQMGNIKMFHFTLLKFHFPSKVVFTLYRIYYLK